MIEFILSLLVSFGAHHNIHTSSLRAFPAVAPPPVVQPQSLRAFAA